MKLNYLVFALLAGVLLASCSPSGQGEKIAKKYCEQLRGFESYTNPSQFKSLKDQAFLSVAVEYNEKLGKYMNDPQKAAEFKSGFASGVQKNGVLFITAYESSIREQLAEQTWYMKDDENKYHLYSFADDSLNILACKGTVAYTLSQDTLVFEDGARAIIAFQGDSAMSLSDPYDLNRVADYTVATQRDLLVGSWNWKSTAGGWGTCTFSAKGGVYWWNSPQSRSWKNLTWRLKPKKDGGWHFSFSGVSWCSGTLKWKDNEKFSVSGSNTETYTRSKKEMPADLSVLFGEKN